MTASSPPTAQSDVPNAVGRRRHRPLALELVDALADRIRDHRYPAGERLPSESAIVEEFGVSRTVVREAISKLQAAGLVHTRHGIGTFVVGLGEASTFRVAPGQLTTLRDVIAVLELRIAIETEAASLAARRATAEDIERMQSALDAYVAAVDDGRDAVGPDFQFHLEIVRATRNEHFVDVFNALGAGAIPRARLPAQTPVDAAFGTYLRLVHAEHEQILEAIRSGDADAARAAMRTHLANSRERRRRAAVAASS